MGIKDLTLQGKKLHVTNSQSTAFPQYTQLPKETVHASLVTLVRDSQRTRIYPLLLSFQYGIHMDVVQNKLRYSDSRFSNYTKEKHRLCEFIKIYQREL